MNNQYLTTGDIAQICEVTANGVVKWIKAGKLKAFKTPGGQRRIRKEDFAEFVKKYEYPVTPGYFKQHHAGRCRILVVDDNREMLRLITGYLGKSSAWDVLTAHNGYEACIKAGSYRPDLILLDIMMPAMDGYEVLRQLQSQPETRDTSIIIMTALNPELVRDKVPADIAIVSKPLDFAKLDQVLRTHLTPAGV